MRRDDVLVMNLSGEKHTVTDKFMNDDPFGLEKFLKEHTEIETVVFDSATAYAVLCSENAVANVNSAKTENLGLKGYGHRNARVLRALVSMMRLTKRLNKHFIIITHEDSPQTNEEGVTLQITMALGGKMADSLGLQLSEVWHMSDTGKERRIAVRPVRFYKPMKTRMFDSTNGEFVFRYNADTGEGEGIAHWHEKWKANGGAKIPLPK
jgi:hypothetical protein